MTELISGNLFELVSVVFGIILIFALSYALLMKFKPLGDNSGIYAIIAFSLAVLILASEPVALLLFFMTPWFFVVLFLGFFVLFTLMMFGLKEDDITAGKNMQLITWVIIISVVILIFGLGNAFGQTALEATGSGTPVQVQEEEAQRTVSDRSVATDDFSTNVLNTLVNPQVLGLIAIMLIGLFAVLLLSKSYADT